MTTYANWPTTYPDSTWFTQDRFGIFIHFGLFSLGARHEWFMTTEEVPPEKYFQYFEHFQPDLLQVDEWAQTIKKTGAKYVVFTTKHHEGFALWDSQYTDFKITKTAYQKDLLASLLPALRNVGLKVGLYHSLIDWHHPDFPLDGLHPLREDLTARENSEQRELKNYQLYLKNQVTELLTNYGPIDYFWFDFSYPHRDWGWSKGKGAKDWDSLALEELCHQLQPQMLLNDRLDLGRGIQTPEQYQPDQPLMKDGLPVLWEACQTMNGTWGYDRDNLQWKDGKVLLTLLIDTVSKNGNFLMNIGPTARGLIDPKTHERLAIFQEWMKLHSSAIYGCHASYYPAPPDCRYTQKGNRLYLHLFNWPFAHLHLKGLGNKISYAQFLHDASEVFFKAFDPDEVITSTETMIQPEDVILELPTQQPDVVVPVVEIFLKG